MLNKKTKIICTIGPSSRSYEQLKALAQAGMDVARLNFSHGTQEEKAEDIENIRKLSKELNKPIAILADLQGPKIRLGEIKGIRKIEKGQIIQLSLNPTSEELPLQFDLTPFVKKGQRIFLNDGLVELLVLEVKSKTIKTKAQNSGVVSSHKGINIPDTRLKGVVFTNKDRDDLEFALTENADYIALSFIQTAEDLKPAHEMIKKAKSKARLMVKIEKKEAVEHLEEIIQAVNAVMVARGDLAIETQPAEVPIIQEKIIKLARQHQKPVVVATQMLESMIENPRPTRAEVSDVANSVLDQVDAVMLSAESASGKYPVEAAAMMTQIILSVEEHPEYKNYIKINWENIATDDLTFSALTSSAASIAYRIGAQAIAVATATGRTARFLSSFRPNAQIIAVTHDEQTRNQLSLIWGVQAVIVKPLSSTEAFWTHILETVKSANFVKKTDKIVMVSGTIVGLSGATDTIKIARV